MNFISGTKLDGRAIRVEMDKGFYEGREYGRGQSGGQVRDDLRRDVDDERGGAGRAETPRRTFRPPPAARRADEDEYGRFHGSSDPR